MELKTWGNGMKTIILNIVLTVICILSSTTAVKAIKNFENNGKLVIEKLENINENVRTRLEEAIH